MATERVIQAAIESPDTWESRLLPCPDGLTRVVCLQPACWRSVDYLVPRDELDFQQVVDRCFHLARDWSDQDPSRDFAYDFAAALEFEIVKAHHKRIKMPNEGIANDSWKCPYWNGS